MTIRRFLPAPLLAVALSGCVDRGGWQPAPQLAPQALGLSHTVADSQVEPTAWPTDGWWRRYGDPQLDALVDEALAGSPSLATAQARLRAAQGAGEGGVGCAQGAGRRGSRRSATEHYRKCRGNAPALRGGLSVPATLRRQLRQRWSCGARSRLGPGFLGSQPCTAGSGALRCRS